jgi:nuclear GTP-binding protein
MPKSHIKSKIGAGRPNQIPRTNAASKLGKGRRKDKDPGSQRSAETINRLKMYNNGKAIRNKAGEIVAGAFQMKTRAGDREITAETGRIQPDRRWFGNTRVVAPTQLDQFRQEMTSAVADPYSVVLKRKKLPMGLLQDIAEYQKGTSSNKAALLEQEPFQHAFGKQSRRKRVKLDTLTVSRSVDDIQQRKKGPSNATAPIATIPKPKLTSGETERIAKPNDNIDDDDDENKNNNSEVAGYMALFSSAQKSQETYETINSAEGIVPWGRDAQSMEHNNIVNVDGWRSEKKDDLFLKGQSKRIWGEFYKVVDCSDVVLHVIDARNVPGTRCTMIEKHLRQHHMNHKHLVFVLNKIDLVPNWVARRWMGELAAVCPTIAFHASDTHAFGKGALISLLRQFGKLHQDKKQISVGGKSYYCEIALNHFFVFFSFANFVLLLMQHFTVIGYPNVGKSSVINTLISKRSCKVAPIPGETKIWQYVTLFKRISLIDCPGVVVDTAGDTEEDSVLKGVVRAERLEHPEDFISAIQKHVQREHIAAQYKIPIDGWPDVTVDDGDNTNEHNSSMILMDLIARKAGRLRKGGDPCLRTAAIMMINDYQRGRLPHYVAPPELKSTDVTSTAAAVEKKGANSNQLSELKHKVHVEQDLDAIGIENMSKVSKEDDTGMEVDDEEEKEDISKGTEKDGNVVKNDGYKESSLKSDGTTRATSSLIGDGEWDD